MNERQEKILELCNERTFIYLNELAELLPNYSLMTLRRDIDRLAEQGQLIKIRGGARRNDKVFLEDTLMRRMVENLVEKSELAEIAIKFCERDSCVFFDSGSTISSLAKTLPDERICVYTTGTNIAQELSQKQNTEVYLPGGQLNKRSLSISGTRAISFFKNLNFHTAFMATSGYDTGSEFSCGNSDECELKRLIIERAERVVMIMDSTKIGKRLAYSFCTPRNVDILIVSENIPKKHLKHIKKANPDIVVLTNG